MVSIHTSARGSHRAWLRGGACRIWRPHCMQSLDLWAGLVAGHDWVRFLLSQARIHRRPGCCPGLQATTLMNVNSRKFYCIRASSYTRGSLRKKTNTRRKQRKIYRRETHMSCAIRSSDRFVALLTNIRTACHEQTFWPLRTSPSVQCADI